MNKKINENLFERWADEARAKIEQFHSYTDEQQLRQGIVEVSTLLSEIICRQCEMSILNERARERESELVEKFNSLLNSKSQNTNESERASFTDNLGIP